MKDLQMKGLIAATFSGPLSTEWGERVQIRSITIKNKPMFQLTYFKDNKAFHRNLTAADCQRTIQELERTFKQGRLFTAEADIQISLGTHKRLPPTKIPQDSTHDRQKNHLLPEGIPDSYLIGLGLMSKSGQIIASKAHKYRQINHFLELVSQWLNELSKDQPLHIVDLGCGKAYLTFALYHYLREIKGLNVRLSGVDLKKDVIQDCQKLAQTLGYDHLQFVVGNIDNYEPDGKVDIVVSLHACNTATDHALAKGVAWKASYLFAAPCCQHELYKQIQCPTLATLLQHGILKERFAAMVTDAVRAELLESAGYFTQILEFVDLEHSPKNLLIRARKQGAPSKTRHNYLELKKMLDISPTLEKLL